jgi:hypothetical protein
MQVIAKVTAAKKKHDYTKKKHACPKRPEKKK